MESKIIKGNIESLKASQIREIEALYEQSVSPGEYVPEELVRTMAAFTTETGREIAIVLDRRNYIKEITVGDAAHVDAALADGKTKGLSGTRLLHTHPNGTVAASDQDLETLRRKKLDSMVVIGVLGETVTGVSTYLIDFKEHENAKYSDGTWRFGIFSVNNLYRFDDLWEHVREIDAFLREKEAQEELRAKGRERAVLVGTIAEKATIIGSDGRALDELAELAETAGATVIDRVTQRRDRPDAKYYLGSGAIDRIKESVLTNSADLVIFDDELSPSQIRNLEDALNVRVIDRTALILDIFAARAKSVEGKLQVELAQQKYRLPRLTGRGAELSRLGGGIGTRGPGESKLETDRRHINRKIQALEARLREMSGRREVLRKERRKKKLPVVAVVGYTNAGKSTLVNALCDSDVFVKDELFATLDTSVRRLKYRNCTDLLLVDTVGFIRKLPHDLIESFKATLEETVYADLLLHVVDASVPQCDEYIDAVETILDEIGAGARPRFLVLNKCDKLMRAGTGTGNEGGADEGNGDSSSASNVQRVPETGLGSEFPQRVPETGFGPEPDPNSQTSNECAVDEQIREIYLSDRVKHTYGKILRVSATEGYGLDALIEQIIRFFFGETRHFSMIIPYSNWAALIKMRRDGNIEDEKYIEEGIKITGTMPEELIAEYKKLAISGGIDR